jgi:large subunit ribosomal protein L4
VEIPVYNQSGETLKNMQVSDDLFAVPFNEAVVHQALVRQRANARQGTASTKTRAEVKGSSHKLFRQKHTGNARAGTTKSPLRRGGGVTFGPKPRSYHQAMPKKMRRLALRCVLSGKVRDGELKVVDSLILEEPKTALMTKILAALGLDRKILIATADPEEFVIRAARNIAGVKTIPVHILNVEDMLNCRQMLLTEAAMAKIEQIWGNGKVARRKA